MVFILISKIISRNDTVEGYNFCSYIKNDIKEFLKKTQRDMSQKKLKAIYLYGLKAISLSLLKSSPKQVREKSVKS